MKTLILNDNFLNEVKISNFYHCISLTQLNLSNRSNLVGERVKKNVVMIDLSEETDAFLNRLGTGFNAQNAENNRNAIDDFYSNEFPESSSVWKNYQWSFFSALILLFIIFLLNLLIRKIWNMVRKGK